MAWEQNSAAISKNGDMIDDMNKGIFGLLSDTGIDANDPPVRVLFDLYKVAAFSLSAIFGSGPPPISELF